MNPAENLLRTQRLLDEMSAAYRATKAAAAVAEPKVSASACSANLDSEKQRVAAIVQRLRDWLDMPTLPLPKVVELTGLSRARIVQLAENGAFERQNGEIVFASVLQHFANRVSKLSAAGKRRSKSHPKASNSKPVSPKGAASATSD